jgi:hypothetical protein
VATGKANANGVVVRTVKIPKATKVGKVSVVVRGANSIRTGKATIRVRR